MNQLAEALGWWLYAWAYEHGMPVSLVEELNLTRAMVPALREWCRANGIDDEYIEPMHLDYCADWTVVGEEKP